MRPDNPAGITHWGNPAPFSRRTDIQDLVLMIDPYPSCGGVPWAGIVPRYGDSTIAPGRPGHRLQATAWGMLAHSAHSVQASFVRASLLEASSVTGKLSEWTTQPPDRGAFFPGTDRPFRCLPFRWSKRPAVFEAPLTSADFRGVGGDRTGNLSKRKGYLWSCSSPPGTPGYS